MEEDDDYVMCDRFTYLKNLQKLDLNKNVSLLDQGLDFLRSGVRRSAWIRVYFYPKITARFCSHQPTVQITVGVKSRRIASEHPGVLTNKLDEDVEIKLCSSM